jgi:hypothetical protein
MDKINQERELFKAEHAKLEDEVSSVTNSLSKLSDKILAIRQDMTKLSSTLREELAEFKNILLSMSETKSAPSPRRKAYRRNKNSNSAATSSNDEKIFDSDTANIDKNKVTPSDRVQKTESWDSMCEESENDESRQERRTRNIQSIYRGPYQDVRRQALQAPSTPSRKSAGAH